MRYKIPIITFIGSLCFFIIPQITKAATYYVAVNGNDSSSGSIAAPFKTFLPAITQANPGDTIYVRGGTYTEENTMVNSVERDYSSYPATSCPAGYTLADNYCFYDVKTFIGLNNFSGWASQTAAHTVNSGTSSSPITIKNYPGEQPILDFSFHAINGSPSAIYISEKNYWVIDGLEITGGNINLWGGTSSNTHDITIQNCNVHDLTIDGGVNPGLIRIDRADSGGAYNITIKNNILHDLFDVDYPGVWNGVPDMQHFGAVTTLSMCAYQGFTAGCTGLITIDGNEIYHVPQAFFFKNAMTGPIEIINNIIHDVDSLGNKQSGNVHMYHNLVYGVDTGFWDSGADHGYAITDPLMHDANGANAIIEYNTFIGLNQLFGITSGTGHTINHNVFFGLNAQVAGAGWDTASFITKNYIYQDETVVAQSLLQQIHSDNNCFISPYSDFQFAARYMTTGIEHYTYSQARETFGFDPNSQVIIQSEPAAVFANPAAHNYQLSSSSNCVGMGYYAISSTQADSLTNHEPFIVTGAGPGAGPRVRVFDRTGKLVSDFYAFETSFHGGIFVATADTNDDGVDEIVVGAGAGRKPEVKIFTKSGSRLATFTAYSGTFRGGVHVAGGDLNGDGADEIITGAGPGARPYVRVFQNQNGTFRTIKTYDLIAYGSTFKGGVFIASFDSNGDDRDELITAPGAGGRSNLRIFSGVNNKFTAIQSGLLAYSATFKGGTFLAGANITSGTALELITAPASAGRPNIQMFSYQGNRLRNANKGFLAYSASFRGGVAVAAADLDLDGTDEIITGAGPGTTPQVKAFRYQNGSFKAVSSLNFLAFSKSFRGGVRVATGE